MKRRFTRREFLSTTAKLGAASTLGSVLPIRRLGPRRAGAATFNFTVAQRRTLDAALARMIPASDPADWSAADVGATDYIEGLLSPDLGATDLKGKIYAGGPVRSAFSNFQTLSRAKLNGWKKEIDRLRQVYIDGLAELDRRAGGDFVSLPRPELQDAILESLDFEGSPFFTALYAHTMEGVYGHPVYRGNNDFRPWITFCYQGDVHGVRFPGIGDPGASWNMNGGYAPEEMIQRGTCPGQQGPTT